MRSYLIATCLLLIALSGGVVGTPLVASDFEKNVKPALVKNCVKCHGGQKVNGKVNFKEIVNEEEFLRHPELIERSIDAISDGYMPPETEPALEAQARNKLLASLKEMLHHAVASGTVEQVPVRRLNRFQYNNCVKDLFGLNRDVFALPEKMMTRYGNYLHGKTQKMPERVDVASLALNPTAGMRNVVPFPKDLRASHGFDNQANQLTLSPLLLDAFLKLSVSIVESPDFNEETVGLWQDFFTEPAAGVDLETEIRNRLAPFLMKAFRSSVDRETLDRYVHFASSKIAQGSTVEESMKKVASAVLSSPLFLYRYTSIEESSSQFSLAANLSFFLWSSGPDQELLELAAHGELSNKEVLSQTIDRMLADSRSERFLDSFPSQWMQLENVLAVTPDPQKNKYFHLNKSKPASVQMLLEPLLLFDAVFIENRPIIELIDPSFSYQSDFIQTWYTEELKPPAVDVDQIADRNRLREEKWISLEVSIAATLTDITTLVDPVKEQILSARKAYAGSAKPLDLRPYAMWEFNGDLKSRSGNLDLKAHGEHHFKEGMVVLDKSFLQSGNLPIELKAKTLEVWFMLKNLKQRGGGLMGVQGPGDFFDTIVLGERKDRHWISGSNGFSRTEDFPGSSPEDGINDILHLVMVYAEDGTTTLYRNGVPYGDSYAKGTATFPKGKSSVLFGLRHLPAGGNKYLSVSIDKARLYNRALNPEEVAASNRDDNLYVAEAEILQALSPEQRRQLENLNQKREELQTALANLPDVLDAQQLQADSEIQYENEIRSKIRSRVFHRVKLDDPRYGGVITNAAMLSMTSGPKRTHPIARGAWVIEVIFNDPPPPPPNDVPPLNEDNTDDNLTIREKFAKHRENPDCAGCHSRLDPLGFALENFDITGRWRDQYENGRDVDSSGKMLKKHTFDGIVQFKESLAKEDRRFAKAFTTHLMRYALCHEMTPADSIAVEAIVDKTAAENFKLKAVLKEVALSKSFLPAN